MQEVKPTFIQACIDGKAKPDELDDYIDLWHTSDSSLPMHQFLGITMCEYEQVVKRADSIHRVVMHYQLEALRRSGRTTRIIDQLIQDLFLTGSCSLTDHYWENQDAQGLKRAMKRVANIVANRLQYEHNMEHAKHWTLDGEKMVIKLINAK